MRSFAYSVKETLMAHNSVIYWTTIAVCFAIFCLFVLWGHRSRGKVLARYEGEEPLARWEYVSLVYSPRIIAGTITALLVMGVVSLPFILVQQFV